MLGLPPVMQHDNVIAMLAGTQRGLLLVGELMTHQETAAAISIARRLGWPIATDVLSGVCVCVCVCVCVARARAREGVCAYVCAWLKVHGIF